MKKLFGALIGICGCFAVLSAAEILFQQPMEENAIRKIDKFKTASLVEADGVKCMHLKAICRSTLPNRPDVRSKSLMSSNTKGSFPTRKNRAAAGCAAL